MAELDFVLEMEAIDRPKEFTFSRGGTSAHIQTPSERLAAWANVLSGKAFMSFMNGKFAPKAVEAAQKHGQTGFRAGVSRGGKPTG